jgi:hypothetical protein
VWKGVCVCVCAELGMLDRLCALNEG